MRRARNLLMALTFAATMGAGSVSDAAPLARIKRDIIPAEVSDAAGRSWTFTPTSAGLRRYGPSVEL